MPFLQQEQLQTSEREKQRVQQLLTRKVGVFCSLCVTFSLLVTSGDRADEKGDRADKKGGRGGEGGGDYQERTAADSGDETES